MKSDGSPIALPAPHFDLRQTLESGQVFHWHADGDGWKGVIGSELVRVEQLGETLLVSPKHEKLVHTTFGLDHPMAEILATFPRDPDMDAATAFCRGLRIMRQEPWECVATFITSAMKQVPHIRQISLTLRQLYGEPVENQFAYPIPENLARAGETELRKAKLGFRAKNLAGAARMVADGKIDLHGIRFLPTDEARVELCRLPGVGEKVANCVLLFAYERLEAFPVDVWIERVLRELYFKRKRNVTSRRLREFAASYFGPCAGYAQQYLFHHARKTWKTRAK
jgi:N-glycosylase/DNA lyase